MWLRIKGVCTVQRLILTDCRGELIFGVHATTKDSIIKHMKKMVENLQLRLEVKLGDYRSKKDLGWLMRETTDGYFYIINTTGNIQGLTKLEDYYMEPELFSHESLEDTIHKLAALTAIMTNEELLKTYDTNKYPTVEDSILYRGMGKKGVETLEGLIILFTDMDLESYIHATYIISEFERVLYRLGEQTSSYTKINKAINKLEGVSNDDEYLLRIVQLYKGGFKGSFMLNNFIRETVEGYTGANTTYVGTVDYNNKVEHNLPTKAGLGRMIHYTLILDEILDYIKNN